MDVQSVSKAVPLYLSSIVRIELTSFWGESHKQAKAYIMGIVHSHRRRQTSFFKECNVRHFHISHNAPYLPSKILHNLCFSFLLGLTAVPREIEYTAHAKFLGANKVHYGKCGSGL